MKPRMTMWGSGLLAEFLHALLAGDRLARTLAGAGVGAGTLAANGKRAAMTMAAIAADVAQAGDVLLDRAAQSAFDEEALVDQADDLGQFLFGEVLGPALAVDACFFEHLAAVGAADAVDVGQADPDRLVGGNIHAPDTRHNRSSFSALTSGAVCVWCCCRSPAPCPCGGRFCSSHRCV